MSQDDVKRGTPANEQNQSGMEDNQAQQQQDKRKLGERKSKGMQENENSQESENTGESRRSQSQYPQSQNRDDDNA